MNKKELEKEIRKQFAKKGQSAFRESTSEKQRQEWRKLGGKNRWKNKVKK